MDINFSEEFKNHSNIDLLKIVLRPNEYTPKALEAATKILHERNVSEDEISLVKKYYEEIDTIKQTRNGKINLLKEKTAEILEPVTNPQTTVKTSHWVNLLLIGMAFQYLWLIVNSIRFLIWFLQCDDCHLSGYDLFQLSSLVYVPIIFYLVFKKSKLGWICLFIENLYGFVLMLSVMYIFFKHNEYETALPLMLFLFPIIRLAFLYFLWKNEIALYFSVSAELKKKTLFSTLVVILIFLITIFLLNAFNIIEF